MTDIDNNAKPDDVNDVKDAAKEKPARKSAKALAADDQPTVEIDPWKDMRTITLPKARTGEEKSQYVCINGRTFLVPKNGKEQTVPYPVYERLNIMLEAQTEEEDFREAIPNNLGPDQSMRTR